MRLRPARALQSARHLRLSRRSSARGGGSCAGCGDGNLPAHVYAITLTGGDAVTQDGMERHVPKRDVASIIAVLLQTGRLRISRRLKESDTLLRELLNFRVKISLSGHDSYEAWREQEHDDLVLAVGLAAWLFEKGRSGYLLFMEEQVAKLKRERAG